MTTAEKIKTIRESKNISQYKLAKLSKHLNQSQICKIENGSRKITDIDLSVISQALGVNILDLLGDYVTDKRAI